MLQYLDHIVYSVPSLEPHVTGFYVLTHSFCRSE